jgi:SAM-dependent methyltransferase
MATEIEREAARVRAAYARRAERGLDSRYDYWDPPNLFIYQARERTLLSLLGQAGLLPVGERRVLDAGCGDGSALQDFLRYGASIDKLYGVDLLEDRVETARQRLPGATIENADAQSLPFPDADFDIVLGFTLFSSVIADEARRRVAAEMLRVTGKNGAIVLYDFWTNPTNRDTRPLRRDHVRALFPGSRIEFKHATLAPPLVRALVRAPGGWLACSTLSVIPFLQTHYVAIIRPRASS